MKYCEAKKLRYIRNLVTSFQVWLEIFICDFISFRAPLIRLHTTQAGA